jgi:hypothetical protein
MAMPYERKYAIGACFLCQQCLYCESKLSITTCQCDLNKKPTLKNTGREKRNLYSRVYNPQTKHTVYNKLQLEKLVEANKFYSYNIDFSSKFNFSLCVICHNVMTRLKRKSSKNITRVNSSKTSKSNSNKSLSTKSKDELKTLNKTGSLIMTEELAIKKEVYEISSDNGDDDEIYKNKVEILEELNKEDSMDEPFEDTIITDEEETDDNLDIEEGSEETLPEISFKLIIKQEKESSAAKWESVSQTTFKNFKRELNLLIQSQLDKWVGYDDYIVSYKLGRETGSGTQLTDEKDWNRFLTEYHKFKKKKELVIFASIKSQKNDSKIDKKR